MTTFSIISSKTDFVPKKIKAISFTNYYVFGKLTNYLGKQTYSSYATAIY